jgi:hypothetical protein
MRRDMEALGYLTAMLAKVPITGFLGVEKHVRKFLYVGMSCIRLAWFHTI